MNKNYYIDDKSRRKRSASQKRRRRRRRTSSKIAALLICFVLMIGVGIVGFVLWQEYSQNYIQQYEYAEYNKELISGELFAEDLCVAAQDVSLDGIETDPSLHGAGLFDLTNSDVKYGYKMFDQLYPASTTKIMTAYLALKYGNLDDVVTMSADSTNFNWDESTCGLAEGDSLTLYDLVCGLMLQSGNDCAAAIAEHISGSQEAFAEKVGISARYVRILCTKDVNVSIAVYYEILKVLNLPADSLLIYVDEAHKKITLPAREGKKHDHKKNRSASALHQSSQS